MATSHQMTSKHIPHFGLSMALVSTLSLGEIFLYFAMFLRNNTQTAVTNITKNRMFENKII